MRKQDRLYIISLIVVAVICTVGPAAATLSANSLVFKSDGGLHNTDGWRFNSCSYIGTFFSVSGAGNVTFTIRAEGQSAGGVLPAMHLHVADSNTSWTVADNGPANTTYSNYTATYNLPAGTYWLRVEHTNFAVVGSEVRYLYVKSVDISGAGVSLLNSATNANCLAAADSYILNYRRGTATVTLNAQEGGVLPAGTSVRVKLRRHAFNFAGAVHGANWPGFEKLPLANTNPIPGSGDWNHQQLIDSHFNMIAPSECGQWWSNEATRDVHALTDIDNFLNYAQNHNLRARMLHCFWYPLNTANNTIQCNPEWFARTWPTFPLGLFDRALQGDTTASQEAKIEQSERIQYYIRDRSHRYDEVEGINEAYHWNSHQLAWGMQGVADTYAEMQAAGIARTSRVVTLKPLGVTNKNLIGTVTTAGVSNADMLVCA